MTWNVPDFETFPEDELDRMIDELTERETELSRERRMLQGQIDILRAERTAREKGGSVKPVDVEELAAILSQKAPPEGWAAKA
jgi:RsiG-like